MPGTSQKREDLQGERLVRVMGKGEVKAKILKGMT